MDDCTILNLLKVASSPVTCPLKAAAAVAALEALDATEGANTPASPAEQVAGFFAQRLGRKSEKNFGIEF